MKEAILEQLRVSEEEMFRFLSDMVRINSVSGNEAELAAFVDGYCKNLGFESEIDRHGNVIAYVRGNRPGKRLAFNSHLDTVPIGEGWTRDPLDGKIEGDRLYGRGSTDCKAAIAAQVFAAKAIMQCGGDFAGEIALCYPVEEEVPKVERKGTLKMLNDGWRADMCVNGEDTDLRVCLACDGMLEIKITTLGVGAHGATNYEGRNAIDMMCAVIAELNKIVPGENKYTGRGTITPGVINGGKQSSVVPDRCELRVSRFTVPGETGPLFLGQVNDIIEKLKREYPGFDAVAEMTYESNPSIVAEDAEIVRAMVETHKELGMECPLLGTPQHDDADFLTNVGKIPTLIYGPGTGLMAHKPDEYVLLSEVVTASQVYALLMKNILG